MRGLNRHTKRPLLVAGLVVTGLAGGPGPAPAGADVSNVATCQFEVHVTLQAGQYRSDSSTVSCRGTVAGQAVDDGRSIEEWGHYAQSGSGNGCRVSFTDNVFAARIERTTAWFENRPIHSEGGFELAPGALTQLHGSGEADGQPFVESGSSTFTPDGGQSCGAITSGTFAQHVTLTDGGDGNPAAQDQVAAREHAEIPSPTDSSPRQADAHQAQRRGGHRRHGRRSQRHRARRAR